MSGLPALLSRLARLVAELRRRRVFRATAAYAVGAFVLLEGADLILPELPLPDGTYRLLVLAALLGFPVVVALSWAYDLSVDGLRRDGAAPAPEVERRAAAGDGVGPDAIRRRVARHPRAWGALAAVVLVLAPGAWLLSGWLGATSSAATVPAPADGKAVVAVLPFEVRGDPRFDYLADGMVDLLSTKLDGAGPLRTVGPRSVLGIVRQETASLLDEAGATRVAERLGADLFVLGDIVEAGGRLQVTASLHAPGSPGSIRESVAGPADSIFELVDALTARLLARRERDRGGTGARVTELAALTTRSVEALKPYLEGEALFRAGQFNQAMASFEEAIALDSTFALAYYRLSIAREWAGQPGATQAAEEALRRSERLSARDRSLVEAMVAARHGDGVRAERLYRNIVATYSDVEAWFQLAEVLSHRGPLMGRPDVEAREPFERVLVYEPDHVSSLWHLARIASVEGRLGAMDSLVQRVTALAPEGDRILELAALAAYRRDHAGRIAETLRRLDAGSDLTRHLSVWNVAAYAGRPDGAIAIAGLSTGPSRPAAVRAAARLERAWLLAGRGQLEWAEAELDALRDLDSMLSADHRALILLTLDAAGFPLRERLEAVREPLSDNVDGFEALPAPYLYAGMHQRNRKARRLHVLGMLDARLGRVVRAERWAAALDTVRATEQDAPPADLAAAVRAEIAVARGDSATALRLLDGLTLRSSYFYSLGSPLYSLPWARLRHASLMSTHGRAEEAVSLLDGFGPLSSFEAGLRPLADLEAGRALARAGRDHDARRRHAAFAARWLGGTPDPPVEALLGTR